MLFKEMKYTHERLTDNYKIESFGYSLLDCGSDNLIGLYRDYDVFFAHQKATCRLGYLEDMLTLRSIEEWTEECGECLWWDSDEIMEAPMYVGNPLSENWNSAMKWFIQIPNPVIRGAKNEI